MEQSRDLGRGLCNLEWKKCSGFWLPPTVDRNNTLQGHLNLWSCKVFKTLRFSRKTLCVSLSDFLYYRGLSNYQYHVEVHLRYHILYLYKEYGTIILVIM